MFIFHTISFSFNGCDFLEFSENIPVIFRTYLVSCINYASLEVNCSIYAIYWLAFFFSQMSGPGTLVSGWARVTGELPLKAREACLPDWRLPVHSEARSNLAHGPTSFSSPKAQAGYSYD